MDISSLKNIEQKEFLIPTAQNKNLKNSLFMYLQKSKNNSAKNSHSKNKKVGTSLLLR